MARKIEDCVVVITGASSGIGRATALAFAGRGAAVVVAARRAAALQDLVAECEGLGARALAVPTDVTDECAVSALAERAAEQFGRIDVWVNNAGVLLYGRFDDCPAEAFRRVLETNFFGYVHGARAALPHFRRQGGGVLINNISMAGIIGVPYWSAYCAAKFALRGFCESLRQELGDGDIHVCAVFPSFIDTPLFQHAANYFGRPGKPGRPIYPPERVAATILALAERPRREVTVGGSARLMQLLHAVAPGLLERGAREEVERRTFTDAPQPPTTGNLFEPMPEWTGVTGGWRVPAPTGSAWVPWRVPAPTGEVAPGPGGAQPAGRAAGVPWRVPAAAQASGRSPQRRERAA